MKKKKLTDDDIPTCKVVDGFVDQFNSFEVRLKPEAINFLLPTNQKNKQPLTTLLSDAITNYTLFKSSTLLMQEISYPKLKNDHMFVDVLLKEYDKVKYWRTQCLYYINYAKNYDLIMENDSLIIPKLNKAKLEIEKLKGENARLQKLNKDLNIENVRLRKLFPDSDKSSVGSLDSIDS